MTLRIGVIGTGAIGRDHTRRINQVLAGAEVVALNDSHLPNAELCCDSFAPNARIHLSAADLIADPDVDAVLICSIGATHEEFVLGCIAAGKPVFCEKPLATSAQGAANIVAAEVAHGTRLVQVGFMRRYDAGYVALKEAVKNRIGAPIMVHAAHRNPQAGQPWYDTTMAIHDTMIHEIDVLRWLLEDDYVSARVLFPRKAARASEKLRDPQLVILETAGGITIDVEIFVNCHYGYDIQCEVVGEDGIASLPDPMAVTLRHSASLQTPILTDWKDRFIDSYDTELRDFLAAAARGTASGPTSWDGYVAALTADACVQAQGADGDAVAITLPPRPALYA